MTRQETMALLSAYAYNADNLPPGALPPGVQRVTLSGRIRDLAADAGLKVELFENVSSGEMYLLYAGTRLTDLKSVVTAVTTGLGLVPHDQLTAADAILGLVNAEFGPVITGGHSEGGLIATLQNAQGPSGVLETYAISSPGARPFLDALNIDQNDPAYLARLDTIHSVFDPRDQIARYYDDFTGNNVIGNSHIGQISLINTDFDFNPVPHEALLLPITWPAAIYSVANYHLIESTLQTMGLSLHPSYKADDMAPAAVFLLGNGLTPEMGGLSSVDMTDVPPDAALTIMMNPDGSPAAVGLWDGGAGLPGALDEGTTTILGPHGENAGTLDNESIEEMQGESGGGTGIVLETSAGTDVRAAHLLPDFSGSLELLGGTTDNFSAGAHLQIGGAGPDQLSGVAGTDVMIGGAGDDSLSGNGGADHLYGGAGNDTIIGGAGDDLLAGGAGNDRLEGDTGDDTLTGGLGDEVMQGGSGSDTYIIDGLGNDYIWDHDPTSNAAEVDRITFGQSITPGQVEVFGGGESSGNDLLFRVTGAGMVWVEDALGGWDGDWNSVIELVEFGDGTVWTLSDLVDRMKPLDPGDLVLDTVPELPGEGSASGVVPVPLLWTEAGLSGISGLFGAAEAIISPIVLDLDRDGVKTAAAVDGAPFDHDGNGFRERSGWVGPDDGLLAWDRNGNGTIDDGSELFGNRTLLRGGGLAANGFAALASWDGNVDGKIDASDALWPNLRMWQDRDSDGVSTPDELEPLNGLGIIAINTSYANSTAVDPEGNAHRQIGSFARNDGSTGAADDVWFQVDKVHTIAPEKLAVPSDIAALPTLPGYGTVYSLRQAMVRDTSGALKGLVQTFSTEADPARRSELMDQILYRWTGSDGIEPTSRGPQMDARQVAVIEAFMGQGYVGYGGVTDPHHTSAPLLLEAYRQLREINYASLMAQTHLAGIYEQIRYTWDHVEGFKGDLSAAAAEIQARLAADPAAGQADLSEFVRSLRAFHAEDRVDYWLFRDMFVTQDPSLGWAIDSVGRNTVIGTSGVDVFTGTAGEDAIRGGAGDDWLSAGGGDDVLYGDDGNDNARGYDGDDVLVGGAGNDQLFGGNGADRLEGGDGADLMSGDAGNDTLIGGAGNDQVSGAAGDDVVNGGAGDDVLAGGDGDDVLDGGPGSDSMQGNLGSDVFVFARGGGQDTIQENGDVTGATDVIRFSPGVAPDDVRLERNADHLVITINGTTDQLTVYYAFGQFSRGNEIEALEFADGTVWDLAHIKDMLIQGTAGPDMLVGYDSPDSISGLAGDDNVAGRGGDDALDGGAGADRLDGEAGNDTLLAGTGNDRLFGGPGNDTLRGGDGDDYLNGSTGADVLDGGPGDDSTEGGPGPDVYLFGLGSGQDTIQDSDATAGVVDVIQIGPGVAPADVMATRNGDHLVLSIIGTTDQLMVYYQFWPYSSDNLVEEVRFADGTVWNAATIQQLVLTGTGGPDTLIGFATDDGLRGLNGNDTLYGRAGNDRLDGGAGADIMAGGVGDDSYVVDDPGDTIIENLNEGTDTIQSSVSYTLSANVENLILTGMAAINGTGNALANTLTGNDGANTLDGGPGNDALVGGAGSDTYVFNPGWEQDTISENDNTWGNTDTVVFGGPVRPIDLVLSQTGNNLAIALHGSTDNATVQAWYSGNAFQAEVIQTGDGSRLLSGKVDLLIQAMANYTSSTGLTWDQAIDEHRQDVQVLLAGHWQPPS